MQPEKQQSYQADDLIGLFAQCFAATEQTRLVSGGQEPYYLPATRQRPYHQIVFTQHYFRSALHEVAHWCVAGKVRRQLFDYGYWYQPDGRNAGEQAAFMQVEVYPQALEWLFCLSCGHSFEVSLDNLHSTEPPDRLSFTRRVVKRAQELLAVGLPPRAQQFCQALQRHWGQPELDCERLVQAGAELIAVEQERQKYAEV